MRASLQPLTETERDLRVFGALVVQPFLLAGLAFVLFPFVMLDGSGRHASGGYVSDVSDVAAGVAFGVGIVAFAITFLLVMPTLVWVLKRHTVTLGHALLFGLAFGNVPFVLGSGGAGVYGPEGALRGFAFSSLLGLAGASVFWAIALRRPVRDPS